MSLISQRFPERNKSLLVLLVALMAVGPLLPFFVSTSSSIVVERFDITAAQFGLISSIVWGSAAIASQFSGWFADRTSIRTQMLFNFGGAAFALVLAGMTTTYAALLGAAIIAGASQSISNPTTNRVILEVVPQEKQAAWIGIKQSGVQMAQLFAGIFFPGVALLFGWVGAALGGAMIALAFILFGWRVISRIYPPSSGHHPTPSSAAIETTLVSPSPESAPQPPATPDQVAHTSSKESRKLSSTIWVLALMIFLVGFGVQTVHVFLPLFSVRTLGFTVVEGGLTLAVIGTIGMFSRIWWARQVGKGARLSTLLMVIILGAAFGVGLIILASFTGWGYLVWAAAAVHGLTTLGANVVINSALMRAAQSGQIGKASGVNSMGMYAGFTIGPLVMGWLHMITSGFLWGWVMNALVFLVAYCVVMWFRNYKEAQIMEPMSQYRQ